ncbi:hypothetical protein N7474_001869 [Penicillium riverlandense]|uniref:uncharacterized protein n=1 Tax=Penicillium riverlandense TaxID=1903569 RepID=UPI0025477054|nr:uncharacterized protein N7474_001869 [Penicillium riverlandense]KAJ5833558.1 hypothetical protein N7474_001869 [Penicillium riverlandense]
MSNPTMDTRLGAGGSLAAMEDPFLSPTAQPPAAREPHRYSSFDTQLFSLNVSSPAQAKRALEAHLAETERRLEEASKLGTALIEQQRELSDQLKEVEQQPDEGEMGPELRRKLADLEKEYTEVGRETARAFLAPKRLVGGLEDTPSLDQKTPLNPALFAGQATNSPSKVSAPSRKQRNQPSNRVHDIEFATEISTSLLAQVRQLQSLLAEREETLKSVNLEKSRLEIEAEGYAQRIRALDESEQRYKDENWALETQTHELQAQVKDATDREKRLTSTLSASNSEKNAVERELEELRQANAKLQEEQTAMQKATDTEHNVLRRNLNASDAEKGALQKKLEELTSQNQELAKAVATRLRQHDIQGVRDLPLDTEGDEPEQITPDNSPPPSPNKFTPRHNHLESETLKSSLGHAHRMIQNLKSTIHREKTEKIELKRMLQEARDEVEQRRRDPGTNGSTGKRQKTKPDSFRKPPRPDLLGAGRKEQSFVELQETDWEDNAGQASPTRKSASRSRSVAESSDEPSDVYQTATEAEDGFETANERGTATESEAFQTGVESMADDSSDDSADLTETEATPRNLTMGKPRDRNSYYSTASTDEDEEEVAGSVSPSQINLPRARLRSKRSVLRRIRPSGEAPMASTSRPSSARNSPAPSSELEQAAQGGQSLFAELADLEGGEEDYDEGYGAASQVSTPRTARGLDSRRSSEAVIQPMRKPAMVDSGVMTDPWEGSMTPVTVVDSTPATPQATETPKLVSSGTQWTPLKPSAADADHLTNVPTPPKMAWDDHSVQEQPREATPLPELGIATVLAEETVPETPRWPELSVSYMMGGVTTPVQHELPAPEIPQLALSSVFTQTTEPVVATIPEPVREIPQLSFSSLYSQATEPVLAQLPVSAPEVTTADAGTSPELVVSSISSAYTEPVAARIPESVVVPEPKVEHPALSVSMLDAVFTQPQTHQPVAPPVTPLSFSTVNSVETLPVKSVPRAIPVVADLSTQTESSQAGGAAVVVHEDSPTRSRTTSTSDNAGLALSDISGNALRQHSSSVNMDHGSQTILSSKQIDQILMDRESNRPLSSREGFQATAVDSAAASPFATPKARPRLQSRQSSTPSSKRPSSANSQVSVHNAHPPLPVDHREVILAAEKKSIDLPPPSPTIMGPPLAPASAYRINAQTRPRTPNEQAVQTGSARTVSSRPRLRAGSQSQMSRRSSVSSFASELEERFNMNNPHAGPMPHGYGPGTDPRMIQAITQTMIGEFLWKYTRKTVSGDFSSTRHRRYFWVHPYTRTLYWSDQDPQTAGKNQLRTKSVPIEAVRVVADDNPYPPGLHCRSLEVVSPGRRVRFTATTSQRHETWFNALSYLLLRETNENGEDQDNGVTLDDIDEFNPGFRSASRQKTRMSFSSQTRQQRTTSAMSMRSATGRASPALSSPGVQSLQVPGQRSASRLSTIFNGSIRGSIASIKGRHGQAASVHDESLHDNDSADDLRQDDDEDRLENVRACCDGKHDVSSLSRNSRYSPKVDRHSQHYH